MLGSVFVDLTPVNAPLSREMYGRPFYKVCLTPDWISIMFGTVCSGTLNFSSRLSVTMCSKCMEK